jgi:hypothetical protein
VTVRERAEEMFWVSCLIVAMVGLWIYAKLLFKPRR